MKKLPFALLVFVFILVAGPYGYADDSKPSESRVAWSMKEAPGRSFKIPQIDALPDAAVMRRVNEAIDQATSLLNCGPDAPSVAEGASSDFANVEFKVKLAVQFDRMDIFSVYVSSSYFCGGAYPTNDSPDSLTFDLRSGEPVTFEKLFRNYENNKKAILSLIFKDQLERTEKVKSRKVRSCDKVFSTRLEEEPDDEFDFSFTENGLAVQPLWPHVVEACAARQIVPYDDLKSYAAPDGILERIIKSGKYQHQKRSLALRP